VEWWKNGMMEKKNGIVENWDDGILERWKRKAE
jgi:hypothetical protein